MVLRAEFTVEPFVEGSPGPHVAAALSAVDADGLDVEFGPFGTTVTGGSDMVLTALDAAVRAAFGLGATRVSLQISSE